MTVSGDDSFPDLSLPHVLRQSMVGFGVLREMDHRNKSGDDNLWVSGDDNLWVSGDDNLWVSGDDNL